MSAFNILQTELVCNSCNRPYPLSLQFKFGDTWQFHYQVGDKIKWGGNDIGVPRPLTAKVYGLAESSVCPFCGYQNEEEYDITVKDGTIIDINPMESYQQYLSNNDGNYFILQE
jgi:hypothetical protein